MSRASSQVPTGRPVGKIDSCVVVVAGAVDREAPVVGGAAVAQPAQLERGAVGQDAVDVAEVGAVTHVHAGQLGPAFTGSGVQAILQRRLRRVGVLDHDVHLSLTDRVRHGVSRHRSRPRVRHKDQMTMSSPYVIVLTEAEDRVLAARVASGRTEYRDRLRAQIVLDAAHGGVERGDRRGPATSVWTPCGPGGAGSPSTRLDGLDRPPAQWPATGAWSGGAGRGRRVGVRAAGRAGRAAVAVELPGDRPRTGHPLPGERSRRPRCAAGWPTTRSSRGSTGPGSRSADPDFAVKAARVLDLYAGIWDGRAAGAETTS